MSGQDYDFFATGRAAPEPVAPPPPPPARARTTFTDPSGRPVNQFGTPIDVAAAPAGPSAAPGYGAQQYAGHGLTSDGAVPYAPPPPAPTAYPASPAVNRFGAGYQPAAYAPPVPPGAYAGNDARPGTVLAAGIIGIVLGSLMAVAGLFLLVASASLGAALGGSSGAVFTLVALLYLAFAALYLVAGIGAVRGRRWAVWTLLVATGAALLLGLLQLAAAVAGGSATGAGVLGLLMEAVVVALLIVPTSWAWLRR